MYYQGSSDPPVCSIQATDAKDRSIASDILPLRRVINIGPVRQSQEVFGRSANEAKAVQS